MTRHSFLKVGTMLAMLAAAGVLAAAEQQTARLKPGQYNPAHESIDMFPAIEAGTIEVTFIPKDATGGQVFIKNNGDKPLNVKLPELFAGVPVLAQMGGGMGGMGGGGGQGMGGGMGGGGMGGMGGGGGGGGFFNVAPEEVGNFKVATVCLDHGKPDPNPRMKYVIQPVDSYVERPAVIETLRMFAAGRLNYNAAQAAVWHLNNDLSWQELAAKRTGSARANRQRPYFTAAELHLAIRIAAAANANAEGKSLSLSQK